MAIYQSPPKPVPGEMSPIRFKMRFTSAERIAIKKSTDEIVQDFLEILDDPRLNAININDAFVQDAVQYLEAQQVIGAGRANEILGIPTPS